MGMIPVNGWTNTVKLVIKNLSMLGDDVEQSLAALNPDAAIALGREEREKALRVVARACAKLKTETAPFERELAAAEKKMATEKQMAAKAVENAAAGKGLTEREMQQLVDSIKRDGQEIERLSLLVNRNKSGIEFMQKVIDERAEDLRKYDAEAAAAKHDLEIAQIRKDQAAFNAEIQGYAKKGAATTAGIGALKRAAAQATADADATEIVSAATSPATESDGLAALRKSVETGGKSALDQLKELSQ